MWIPLLLGDLNIEEMQAMGCKLSAEDIYSINHGSLKDAILQFGGGCTGSVISPEGLVLTNHHCGYGWLQRHSSVENDILTNGFWAMSKDQELKCPGLTVMFIVSIEDVTYQVLDGVTDDMDESQREAAIAENMAKLTENTEREPNTEVQVKSFFAGNEYYMFVTKTYRDVRLVGAPSGIIGKFGGDTDNWVWPRHTGDFSLFRIYANAENEPADVSDENVPFKPKHYLPVSVAGVDTGDFTMVFGFPGMTQEYLTSYAVREIMEMSDPTKIALRQMRLDVINKAMAESDAVRIQYASKQAGIANAWKKWQGEVRGLNRLNALDRKREQEERFQRWAEQEHNKKPYASLLPNYQQTYEQLIPYWRFRDLMNEAFLGSELMQFASRFYRIHQTAASDGPLPQDFAKQVEGLMSGAKSFFKDFHEPIERELFPKLMAEFYNRLEPSHRPPVLVRIHAKYRGNWNKFAAKLFSKSMLLTQSKVNTLDDDGRNSILKLTNDPAFALMKGVMDYYFQTIKPEYDRLQATISYMDRWYLRGLRLMLPERKFYPDANSTLRITYGKVENYLPQDAVQYNYATTLEGIIEKSLIDNPEYEIDERLLSLYDKKDYGPYGVNGVMPVCFIASNHTTGGNSGSPAINANGELIGLNFDRNWEGTMSDIMYDPDQCRNIMVDTRYILFVIHKYAGATHLVNEMTLRWGNRPD